MPSNSRKPEPFPKGLQTLREACGLTRVELAQKMTTAGFTVSESEVARWESGQAKMTLPALAPLLEVLGTIVEARLAEQVWGSEAAREDELAEAHLNPEENECLDS